MTATTTAKPGYGQFGNLAEAYVKGRKGYPNWVFDFLKGSLPVTRDFRILDAGCGTGISTRQLAREIGCRVVGVDHDVKMITEAEHAKGTMYLQVPFTELMFEPGSFLAVTAFSSFHWFAKDAEIMSALLRFLPSGGCFLVVNKNTRHEVVPNFRDLVNDWTGKLVPDAKADYEPYALLEGIGLSAVWRSADDVEHYTVEEALALLESKSLWNLVPDSVKPEARGHLLSCLKQSANAKGIVTRVVTVDANLGIK